MAIPGGMVLQPGVGGKPGAEAAVGGVTQGVFRYPGYVYTTVYSPGQQVQYVLPASLTPETSISPKKLGKN